MFLWHLNVKMLVQYVELAAAIKTEKVIAYFK